MGQLVFYLWSSYFLESLDYVVQSFFHNLIFTVSATMSVQPIYFNDNIGAEDPESLSLDLVIQAVTDPSQIEINPGVANVNILDDEGMK